MKRNTIFLGLFAALIAGCSSMQEMVQGEKVQYKSAGKVAPLDIPPDLTSPTRDDRYSVPEAAGATTLSTYSAERGGASKTNAQPGEVLPAGAEKVRVERNGNQRWLVVPETPEKVWPLVKEFWQESGFLIKLEVPEAGVMETDWAENRAKIPDDAVRNFFGKFIDAVYSTAERDKFRTRLERGTDPSTTEIYISHRGVIEVFNTEGRDSTVWQPRPADTELEAEFLRRLMTRFGVDTARAKAQVVKVENKIERAKLVRGAPGAGAGTLELSETFDRAWRRVGLALDRVGFTVEDRDRSKGYYFVRYVDPKFEAQQNPEKDKGVLSKLAFWKSDKPTITTEQYRVMVKGADSVSQVQVLAKDGSQDNSDTGRRILALLLEQLK